MLPVEKWRIRRDLKARPHAAEIAGEGRRKPKLGFEKKWRGKDRTETRRYTCTGRRKVVLVNISSLFPIFTRRTYY